MEFRKIPNKQDRRVVKRYPSLKTPKGIEKDIVKLI